MATEKVTEILNPSMRTGQGAKGMWTMVQIQTDANHVATAFAPINVGDEVEMEWNDKYGNWSAKKAKKSYGFSPKVDNTEVMEALRALYKMVAEIKIAVMGEPDEKPAPEPVKQPVIVAPEVKQFVPDTVVEPDDQPFNLDDIPF